MTISIVKISLVVLVMVETICAITIGTTSPTIVENKGKDLKVEESRGDPPPEFYSRGGSPYYYDRYKEKYGDRYNNFVTQPGPGTGTQSYDSTRYSYAQPGYSSYSTSVGTNKYKYPPSSFGPSTASPNNYFYQNGGVYDNAAHPSYHTTKVPVTQYGSDIPSYPNYLSSTYPATSNSLDYGNGGQQPSSFFGKDIKTILPYAGAALLGIAAALAVNPRLLSRITGHVDNSLYSNGYNGGYNDPNKYNNYYGGNSGYGHSYAGHHHGRKRREAERKFGQTAAYRHHAKRN